MDFLNTSASTGAAPVAVADPAPAPYGDDSFRIMSNNPPGMNFFNYTVPATVPNPLPSYLAGLYANIDLTWASVLNGTNKSGLVSKAQICNGIAPTIAPPANPTYTYVEFTGSNYILLQSGILIKSGLTGQDQIGSDLFTFMLNNTNHTYWNTFLGNHCYKTI